MGRLNQIIVFFLFSRKSCDIIITDKDFKPGFLKLCSSGLVDLFVAEDYPFCIESPFFIKRQRDFF